MKPYAFHPKADKEYTQAAKYYHEISSDLGARFYDEIERLIRDIRTNPRLFRHFDPPARRHFSTVFPYAVIFEEQPDRMVVAVMHMKLRPGYWRERIPAE